MFFDTLTQKSLQSLLLHPRLEVTGLIEGQWYAYRVRALNRLGSGRPSKATDEILAIDPKGMIKDWLLFIIMSVY